MGCIYRRKKKLEDGTVIEAGPYWIKYYRNYRAICESTETDSYSKAKSILNQKEGDVSRGAAFAPKAARILVDELLKDVLNDYKMNHRKTTDDVEGRCRNHLSPYFGRMRAANVTTATLRAFIVERQQTGVSNAQINRELAVLRRGYSLAVSDGKLLHKPSFPMLRENNVRTGFFEREQFEAVRKDLPEYLQPVVTFAYITGWRTNSEILTLQWGQVDFNAVFAGFSQKGVCRLNPGETKNDEGRVFPFGISPELSEVFQGQWKKRIELQKAGVICPWVFHRNGTPIGDYRKSWENACKAAGFPTYMKRGRRVSERIPHDFRRTAVRNLERAGVPRSVAMKLTGHKTESVYRRYAIVCERDLAEGVAKLAALTVTKSVTASNQT